ncbi:hypothetical protein [Sinorhizobium meliloti]
MHLMTPSWAGDSLTGRERLCADGSANSLREAVMADW